MSAAHYLLQVNIYLIVFYGFYRLLLDRETYFTGNRAYLLGAGVLSLLIPFIRLDWFNSQPVTQRISLNVSELYLTAQPTDGRTMALDWGSWITLIYVAGAIFFLLRFMFQLFSLSRLMKNIPKGAAFSFFTKVIVDPRLPQQAVVCRHEEIHVRQLHSFDVLFFELLGVFVWINPVIYLYKQNIREIHEYLADAEAARFQGDKQEYALLLLSSAFGVGSNTLTNSFFLKSTLKKRIFMLHKTQSKRSALLKYGLILPVFGLMLLLSSATVRQNEQIKFVATNVLTGAQFEAVEASISPASEADTREAMGAVQEKVIPPSFPGGMTAFYEYLGRTIKYPAEARKQNIEGKVYLSFMVEKDGSLSNIQVTKKLGGGIDEEAVRVLRESPKWIPGTRDKQPVRVKYDMPLSFSLSEKDKENQNVAQNGNQNGTQQVTQYGNQNENTNKQITTEVTSLRGKRGATIEALTFSTKSLLSDQPGEKIAYSIDGAPVSSAEVRALDAKTIKSIDVHKAPAGTTVRGYTSTVAVKTQPLEIEITPVK
jgi:TonB family protein